MNTFFQNFGGRIIRTAVAAFTCALLVLGAATPAFAFGSSSSSPAKGVTELNDVQAESKQAVEAEPRNLKEIQDKAKRGPNEVQGSAGMDKMNNPANSRGATSVREQVGKALND